MPIRAWAPWRASNRFKRPTSKRSTTRWYHPNNAIYVIAGDVDPAHDDRQSARALRADPGANRCRRAPPVDLQPLTAATFTDESDLPYTLAMIGYRVPGYDDADYFASEILSDVLNSQRGALFESAGVGQSAADVGPSADISQGRVVVGRRRRSPIGTPGTTAVRTQGGDRRV